MQLLKHGERRQRSLYRLRINIETKRGAVDILQHRPAHRCPRKWRAGLQRFGCDPGAADALNLAG